MTSEIDYGPPTEKQLEALRVLIVGMRKGWPMSAGQMAKELGLHRRSVVCRISGLKLRGYVEVRERRQWGIIVLKDEKGRPIKGWQEVM